MITLIPSFRFAFEFRAHSISQCYPKRETWHIIKRFITIYTIYTIYTSFQNSPYKMFSWDTLYFFRACILCRLCIWFITLYYYRKGLCSQCCSRFIYRYRQIPWCRSVVSHRFVGISDTSIERYCGVLLVGIPAR